MTQEAAPRGTEPATPARGRHASAEPRAGESQPTVALPRPEAPPAAAPSTTVVIEDGVLPRRLRRPLDLARFLVAAA
ncbi:MAG: hypothetical protein ACKOMX_06515, partial [Actinomycetota bacterium]